jgi:hypothetical protein
MTLTLKITDLQFKAKLSDLSDIQRLAMPQIYQEFLKLTPVDTGNARSHTQIVSDKIEANYDYAEVLDAGRGFRDGQMRGSEQAPDGMTAPTKEFAKKLIPQIIQQLGRKR